MIINNYLKQLLLFLCTTVMLLGFQTNSFSQCTPDLSITAPGITPDSATNFLPGIIGAPYNQVVQVKAPVDSIIIVGGFPVTAVITNITLTSLNGLPPGLSSACVPSNCIYPGGANGCVSISGTPTTAGIYPVQAVIATSAVIFGATNVQVDTIDYYFIDISTGIGIDELSNKADIVLEQNVPNPVSDFTKITYYSSKERSLVFTVHDLLGSTIVEKEMEAHRGQNIFNLNLTGVSSGVYVYSISNDEMKATKRLVIAGE